MATNAPGRWDTTPPPKPPSAKVAAKRAAAAALKADAPAKKAPAKKAPSNRAPEAPAGVGSIGQLAIDIHKNDKTLPLGAGQTRGLQLTDLNPMGQRLAENVMIDAGRGMKEKAKTRQVTIKTNVDALNEKQTAQRTDRSIPRTEADKESLKLSDEDFAKKVASRSKLAEQDINALGRVIPAMPDGDIDTSIEAGGTRRADLMKGAYDRHRLQQLHLGDDTDYTGANWYPGHAQKLVDVAREHGMPGEDISKGSILMSPQNPPSNELAAIGVIAKAHNADAPGTISVNSAVKKAAGGTGLKANTTVNFADMSSEQFARLTTAEGREKVQAQTDNTDLQQMSRGGTKENIVKAIDVVRGGEFNLNHLSAPKLSGYGGSTEFARQSLADTGGDRAGFVPGAPAPGTRADGEFALRAAHVREVLNGQQIKGQGMLDLYGLQDSTEGILNPKGNTAEDTWMNGIQTGLPMTTEGGDGSIGDKGSSPAKTYGSGEDFYKQKKTTKTGGIPSHPSGGVPAVAIQHAVNNAASIRAAEMIGHETGLVNSSGESMVPSQLAQAVSWTESRVRSGAADDHPYGNYRGNFGTDRSISFSPQFEGTFEDQSAPAVSARAAAAEAKKNAPQDPKLF